MRFGRPKPAKSAPQIPRDRTETILVKTTLMLSPRLRLGAPFESQIWHSKLLLTSIKRSSMRPPRFLSPKIPKLSPNGASTLLIYLIFRSFDLKQSFSVYWSQNSESNQNLREIHEEDVIFKQGVVVRSEQQNSSQFVRRCLLR